jgi:gamma-glutamyl-gamma-aminobutyrate hydrolase PuuD
MTPLIGITTYNDTAQWRDWSSPAALIPRTYVDAVRRSGGRPVLLPPGGDPAEAAATVADLDGVIVSGGGDVDPARYGAAAQPETGAPNPERDAWELAVLDAALAAGVPVLAVCRGIQLLNVTRGGTLHQHLPQVVGHEEHSGPDCGFGRHRVRVGDGGVLSRILGPGGPWLDVPTHHHQAVDRLGEGLVATAWAADGTVEAVEFAAGEENPAGFAIGVQWHPEEGSDPRLFDALAVAAAGRSRSTSGDLDMAAS